MLEIGLEINLDTSDFDTGLELFMRGCEEATRAAESSAAAYDMLGRVVDDFARAMAELEPLLWRIQRPWAMLRWGGALTLAIAGAAIWGG